MKKHLEWGRKSAASGSSAPRLAVGGILVLAVLLAALVACDCNKQTASSTPPAASGALTDSLADHIEGMARAIRSYQPEDKGELADLTARIDTLIEYLRSEPEREVLGKEGLDSMLALLTEIREDSTQSRVTIDSALAKKICEEVERAADASERVHLEIQGIKSQPANYRILWAGLLLLIGFPLTLFAIRWAWRLRPLTRWQKFEKVSGVLVPPITLFSSLLSFTALDLEFSMHFDSLIRQRPHIEIVQPPVPGVEVVPDTALHRQVGVLSRKADDMMKRLEHLISMDSTKKPDCPPDTVLYRTVDSIRQEIDRKRSVVDTTGTVLETLPSIRVYPTGRYELDQLLVARNDTGYLYGDLVDAYRRVEGHLRAKLRTHELVSLTLVGNTDIRRVKGETKARVGSNTGLAQLRAEAVKERLLKSNLGIDSNLVVTLHSALPEPDSLLPIERRGMSSTDMAKQREVQVIAGWREK